MIFTTLIYRKLLVVTWLTLRNTQMKYHKYFISCASTQVPWILRCWATRIWLLSPQGQNYPGRRLPDRNMICKCCCPYSPLEHMELLRSQALAFIKSTSPPTIPRGVGREQDPWNHLPRFNPKNYWNLPEHPGPFPSSSYADSNMYEQTQIHKQRESVESSSQNKASVEYLVIESSMFPAAQPQAPPSPPRLKLIIGHAFCYWSLWK